MSERGASEMPLTCLQTLQKGEDCCTAFHETCPEAATWQRAEDGVRLCDEHIGNARKFGGAKLGYWVIGDVKVPYPGGWTRIEDGQPLIDEAPVQLKPSASSEDPKIRPSGLVLP